ncbi:hypothetical protein VBD025_01175 [Virgibacillus flavescens]|uniref:hypothetical protein n=1 Tax=Virgibacillus flavescens TaxID=1611422 RepID=UPI003D33A002
MKKSVLTGLTVGILAGIAGLVTEYVMEKTTGLSFEELTPVSIMLSCIITNIAGAIIFQKLDKKASRSRFYYGIVVGTVTFFTTLNTIANPPQEQFGVVAHPVHLVVALLSFCLIPSWMKKNNKAQDNSTAKAI